MKKQKQRSPFAPATRLGTTFKQHIQEELQKPIKPITTIFSTVQEQQEKRNANSIKKILKELTDLKKELRDVKQHSRSQNSQDLDMSVCRRLHREGKSPSPPLNHKSHSSSRRKGTSNTKEISTQTKPKRK